MITDTDRIDALMDEFNFERVHTAMTALNWMWATEGIPHVSSLRKTARRLLKKVDPGSTLSTGGLYAERSEDGKGLTLSFRVESLVVDEEGDIY